MKVYFLLFGFIFLAVGCSPVKSTSEDERHQAELTLHEVQTNVDDFHHDLNCYKTDFHILESKLENQAATFAKLRETIQREYQGKIENLLVRLKEVESKNAKTEEQSKEILLAMKDLTRHADETAVALKQYRTRINDFEKTVIAQNLQLEEIKQMKGTLEEMATLLKSEEGTAALHRVRSGESLEKIAKQYNVSINSLKKINRLDEDLIMIGQELKIPSK